MYTGPLDELFLGRFGRLPYRSLDFVYETYDEEMKFPVGTVNYTVSEDYTRITEFKHLTGQVAPNTTIMKEYSRAYENPREQIPYYAIINPENNAHYQRYRTLTESLAQLLSAWASGRVSLLQHGRHRSAGPSIGRTAAGPIDRLRGNRP